MARSQRKYDHEYKVQAVKLAREIGGAKAAKELGVPEGTIHTWLKVARSGGMDIGEGSHTPESAMSLAEELAMLRKKVKDQDKEIRRLKEENDFLEEASAFFAASRRKSARSKELNSLLSRLRTARSRENWLSIAVCSMLVGRASIITW